MAPRLKPIGMESERHQAIKLLLDPNLQTDAVYPSKVTSQLAQIAPISVDDRRLASRWIAKCLAARYLLTARKGRGWSQRELSNALGLQSGYVPQSESTALESKVPIDHLVHVALVTGVPIHIGVTVPSLDALTFRVQQLEKQVVELQARLDAEIEINTSLFRKLDSERSGPPQRG